jgi:hypothetical protein
MKSEVTDTIFQENIQPQSGHTPSLTVLFIPPQGNSAQWLASLRVALPKEFPFFRKITQDFHSC